MVKILCASRIYIFLYLHFYLKEKGGLKRNWEKVNKEGRILVICMDSAIKGGQVQWERKTK